MLISKGDFLFQLEITLAEIVAALVVALFLVSNMTLNFKIFVLTISFIKWSEYFEIKTI